MVVDSPIQAIALLINSLSARVLPGLMQNQGSSRSRSISLKCDLSINNFVKEIPLAFRENLKPRLAGELDIQPVVFQSHCDYGSRSQLIATYKLSKILRIHFGNTMSKPLKKVIACFL
jgi:hypothetical protein